MNLTTFARSFAKNECKEIYTHQSSDRKSHEIKVLRIKQRLEIYFKNSWNQTYQLSDANAAKRLIEKLEKNGSELDFELFDNYLSILESTKGFYFVRTPGFYIDLEMGVRPKSNFFQERHWDWNIFEDYFFNTPLTVSLTKKQDLNYLKHVLSTAKSTNKQLTLKEVLEKSHETWCLKYLAQEVELKKG